MGDLINILSYWDDAQQAVLDKDYERAARLYLLCNIYYANGELGMYDVDAEKKGRAAYKKYWKILKRLPQERQTEIKREYAIHFRTTEPCQLFLHDWRTFTIQQIRLIYNLGNNVSAAASP